MGGVVSAVKGLVGGVTSTIGSVAGLVTGALGLTPQTQSTSASVGAVNQDTPTATPTEESAMTKINRKRKGKAALTVPTTGAGTGGTGLNV